MAFLAGSLVFTMLHSASTAQAQIAGGCTLASLNGAYSMSAGGFTQQANSPPNAPVFAPEPFRGVVQFDGAGNFSVTINRSANGDTSVQGDRYRQLHDKFRLYRLADTDRDRTIRHGYRWRR